MRTPNTTISSAALGFLLLAGIAPGKSPPTYRFIFQQASYQIGVGQSVSLPVYLEETVSGTTPSLLVSENGVESVGVKLVQVAPLPSSPARFVGATAVNPNTANFFPPGDPLFPPVITVPPNGSQAALLQFARGPGVTGNATGSHTRDLFLGNFNITAGTVPGEVTTIRAQDYAATSDTITWANLIALDDPPYGIGSTSVTITAVGAPCYANCDQSTGVPILSVNDFLCFQNRFALGDVWANCDGSTTPPILNVNDFICFQSRFASGCP